MGHCVAYYSSRVETKGSDPLMFHSHLFESGGDATGVVA
jgi:hypothetical protein